MITPDRSRDHTAESTTTAAIAPAALLAGIVATADADPDNARLLAEIVTRKRPGRPRVDDGPYRYLTRSQCDAWFEALCENSGNVRKTCKALGVRREDAYRERRINPEFAELWDEALIALVDEVEARLFDMAINGTTTTYCRDGATTTIHKPASDRSIIFILRHRRPEIYGWRSQFPFARRDDQPQRREVYSLVDDKGRAIRTRFSDGTTESYSYDDTTTTTA